MPDTTESTESTDTPSRPSIALTTPFLSLAAAVIALAAFLLGFVVKDIGAEHHRPEIGIARFHDEPGNGPGALERGHGAPALPERALDKVTAGTVTSVDGTTVTLKAPNGKTVKVKLDKDAFVVVRTSTDK
jgi:hypothetical protein